MKQEVNIIINYAPIITRVKHQLSLLGKRTKNNDGASLFSYVTLSSAEENALTGYVKSGLEKVVASIRGFVTKAAISDNSAELTVENTRWKIGTEPSPFADSFTECVTGYLTSFAISEYLTPNFPQLAAKFTTDAAMHMDTISTLMFYKQPPEVSSSDYSSITGEVTK